MADDKKDDKKEEGGEQNFAVIPMKYITPILIILIVIGTFGKFIAPNFTASLGPIIVDPFASILWAYGGIIFISTFLGGKKTTGQAFTSVLPMIILALVIPTIFGSGMEYVIFPIIFMVAAPLLAIKLREKFGVEFSIEEEEKEMEFDIKDLKVDAKEIKKNVAAAAICVSREESILGKSSGDPHRESKYNELVAILKRTHKFAHNLMKVKEKDLKKMGKKVANEAEHLEEKAEELDQYVYSIRQPIQPPNNATADTLDKLLGALREIKEKLNIIHNALS